MVYEQVRTVKSKLVSDSYLHCPLPLQFPLQHSGFTLHAPPDTEQVITSPPPPLKQKRKAGLPLLHDPEQQSGPSLHGSPSCRSAHDPGADVGPDDGDELGSEDGAVLGDVLGIFEIVGELLGEEDGDELGFADGVVLGDVLGIFEMVGEVLGEEDGLDDGDSLGEEDGDSLGEEDGGDIGGDGGARLKFPMVSSAFFRFVVSRLVTLTSTTPRRQDCPFSRQTLMSSDISYVPAFHFFTWTHCLAQNPLSEVRDARPASGPSCVLNWSQ